MKGHARTAGLRTQRITIGGKEYTLTAPPVVGLYAKLEDYILSRREDPLSLAAMACQKTPAEQHAAIWEAAMKVASQARAVPASEMIAFESTLHGVAFKLWSCLQTHHADKFGSVADVLGLIEAAGEDRLAEITAKVHVATGEADAGNLSGRTQNDPGPAASEPAKS